jgi:transaldolase/glucose-6-phosphate isomerase
MDILKEVKAVGASLWLDNLSRDLLLNGSLAGMIKELGVTGVTSNPSIFEASILKSSYYTETIEGLAARDATAEIIFETLALEDIQRAADLFRDIYKETGGQDGFVSIEVKPSLACDLAGTVREGERLFTKIGRKNVMIKVPATAQGVGAGNALLKKGVNVNFTLIFSPDRYEEVVRAYIDALAWRTANGLPVNALASVASFFVSRIDTAADDELEVLLAAEDYFDNEELYDFANAARGRTAVANSLVAYGKYSIIFASKEFQALKEKGAMKQRILWASTGVKNPAYKDTLYADALLLPDSINTLPENTLRAFVERGNPDKTPVGPRVESAVDFFKRLETAGVGFRFILEFLESDGVERFSRAYDSLISHIEEKKRSLSKSADESAADEPPACDYKPDLNKLKEMDFVKRLWNKDAGLWKSSPEHAAIINNSLGWLDSPFKMLSRVKEIGRFRDEIIKEGFSSVVLLGMGGSSLAPEVLKTVFQNPKNPRLYVLDTTDPAWILSVKENLNLKKTLFIFASKSGGTIEPSSQFKYFWSLLKKAGVKKPGNNFAAITDPGTGLAKLAKEKKFRKVFINFADIGGRFSALSYFGLVPAALCGADIKKLLERAIDTANRCKNPELAKNPGAMLGALIGGMALKGRDKLTLIMPKNLEIFGLWVEQLVAESTGKEGRGVVPVCMEELSAPDKYQADRFFVHTQLGAFLNPGTGEKLGRLKKAGQPVYTMFINDPYDLGGEFFRWEAATAAAGALLEINPFDQPNVKEAKDLTMKVLATLTSGEKFPAAKPEFSSDRLEVYASDALLKNTAGQDGPGGIFRRLFSELREKEYIALLAYLPNTPKVETELKSLRAGLKECTNSATTLSYGPRYLHSSGQLHKGGPDNALFVILTTQAKNDINIIGEKYTFRQLEMAQALGDFKALDSKNRRVLRIHLKLPLDKSLRYLNERISKAGRTSEPPDAVHPQGEENTMLKLAAKKNTSTRNTTTTTVRTPAKTAAQNKLTSTNEYVLIDYPKNLENITTRNYSVRIAASAAAGMDISINDAPWQGCRHSVGYWWFDWTNFTPGTHQLVARMHKTNGEYLISKRRRCKVS